MVSGTNVGMEAQWRAHEELTALRIGSHVSSEVNRSDNSSEESVWPQIKERLVAN